MRPCVCKWVWVRSVSWDQDTRYELRKTANEIETMVVYCTERMHLLNMQTRVRAEHSC